MVVETALRVRDMDTITIFYTITPVSSPMEPNFCFNDEITIQDTSLTDGGDKRRDSAMESSNQLDTPRSEEATSPAGDLAVAVQRKLKTQSLSDKVFITNLVERNNYFFPFDPTANPMTNHNQREAFVQAVLRDLDKLYIRIIDEREDYRSFKKIATDVASLGMEFDLVQFEVVLYHVVKRLDVQLDDFEVFRGLQAWREERKRSKKAKIQGLAPVTSGNAN